MKRTALNLATKALPSLLADSNNEKRAAVPDYTGAWQLFFQFAD